MGMASNMGPSLQTSHPNIAPAPNLIDPDLLQTANYANTMLAIPGKVASGVMNHRTPGCSLDLLSDAANHLASNDQQLPPMMREIAPGGRGEIAINGQQGMHYDSRINEDATMRNSGFPNIGPSAALEDYNIFLDDFGISSHYFLPVDTELPVMPWPRAQVTEHNSQGPIGNQQRPLNDGQEEHNSFSRFGSRLPSLQPESQDASENRPKIPEDILRTGPPWKVSGQDHRQMRSKLEDFSSVLPKGFALPSRHTLSRFLEGYINGFHEHLPFLHIPTLIATSCAPELLLALAAIGAQYRFENHRGNGLWYAARSVAMEQVRRRNSQQVLEILSPPSTYRSESTGLSPVSIIRHSDIPMNENDEGQDEQW
jgi:hypothetical protein